jgi:hypothetical protein
MAPATVIGNAEIRIVASSDVDDVVGAGVKAIEAQRKVSQLILRSRLEDLGRAFANGGRRAQRRDLAGGVALCSDINRGVLDLRLW